MRLVVDKWIYTTVKQNKTNENEENSTGHAVNTSEFQEDFTVDQRLEQELNLFDTSRSSQSLSDSDTSILQTKSTHKSFDRSTINIKTKINTNNNINQEITTAAEYNNKYASSVLNRVRVEFLYLIFLLLCSH